VDQKNPLIETILMEKIKLLQSRLAMYIKLTNRLAPTHWLM